jgi:hypothetical protein
MDSAPALSPLAVEPVETTSAEIPLAVEPVETTSTKIPSGRSACRNNQRRNPKKKQKPLSRRALALMRARRDNAVSPLRSLSYLSANLLQNYLIISSFFPIQRKVPVVSVKSLYNLNSLILLLLFTKAN